jgi:hypothetical protein
MVTYLNPRQYLFPPRGRFFKRIEVIVMKLARIAIGVFAHVYIFYTISPGRQK